jgi:hypothetical protein
MCGLMAAALCAQELAKDFVWEELKIGRSVFTQELGMLDAERDDYATNLAIHAAGRITASKGSAASLDSSRRVLALALQLSPRNKRAVVLNFQLARRIMPEPVESNYSPQVFARLLLTRGQLLEKQGGAENTLLARAFILLAATMDPTNEDAVYAAEMHRLDHGAFDWKWMINGRVEVEESGEDAADDVGNDSGDEAVETAPQNPGARKDDGKP